MIAQKHMARVSLTAEPLVKRVVTHMDVYTDLQCCLTCSSLYKTKEHLLRFYT